VEVDAGAELAGGDEPEHAGSSPRRDDLDVQPRVRPLASVEGPLVDPQHVRRLPAEEPIERLEHVDEQRCETFAAGVVERGEVGAGAARTGLGGGGRGGGRGGAAGPQARQPREVATSRSAGSSKRPPCSSSRSGSSGTKSKA